MSQQSEHDKILDHSYDGIQEYDNPMPRWWVYLFWATIIFSVIYALNIGGVGSGAGRVADYERDMAQARERFAAAGGGATTEAGLAALVKDPQALATGKQVFGQSCAACHRMDGGGMIGPNLTDDYWLHGGSLMEIHKTVAEGVLAKGMPAWAKMLKPEQLDAVTAYVASLHGTNPPNPKPPQGELVAQ